MLEATLCLLLRSVFEGDHKVFEVHPEGFRHLSQVLDPRQSTETIKDAADVGVVEIDRHRKLGEIDVRTRKLHGMGVRAIDKTPRGDGHEASVSHYAIFRSRARNRKRRSTVSSSRLAGPM